MSAKNKQKKAKARRRLQRVLKREVPEVMEYDTFILGKDERCHVSTDCRDTNLNNNIVVVGGSGSGKTTAVMLPILMHLENANAVVIMTKWGMLSAVRRLLQKRGYKVHLLNLCDPASSEYSYDPLSYCKIDEDIRDLAHAIVYSAQGDRMARKDPFWDTSAENLLEVVLWVVKHYAVLGKETMATALKLLDRLVWVLRCEWEDWEEDNDVWENYPAHLILEKFSANNDTLKTIWRGYTDLPEQTGSCVTSSMQVPLRAVFPSSVRKCVMNPKQFDFSELTKPKTVLFVYVSPVNTANHRFASLFYRQMFKTLFEIAEARKDRMLPYPVHVLCDDFATGAMIPDFDQQISIFREKRISATMLIQSESQLVSLYGKGRAQTIINNCDTYVYLGGMDTETCLNISQKANVPFDEVMDMPLGTEYFIRRGQKAIKTEKYDTFHDPVFVNELQRELEKEDTKPAPEKAAKDGEEQSLYDIFNIEMPTKKEGADEEERTHNAREEDSEKEEKPGFSVTWGTLCREGWMKGGIAS